MFHVGDMVKALDDGSHYTITTRGWIGYVTRVINDDIIHVSNNRNGHGALEEWRVSARYFELVKSTCIEEKEENKMDVKEIITEEERKSLLKDMEHLLDEYDYDYTDEALNKIIDTWAENKADLITAFKKHPNYLEGKFMIAFSHDYARRVDARGIIAFRRWVLNPDNALAVREFMPEEMREYVIDNGLFLPSEIFDSLRGMEGYQSQYITAGQAGDFNKAYANINACEGQKLSRVMNKLLTYVGYNKLPDYNREFAKYADAINPLQITRHTILSVNPLDYLTMSFGNSWASCHTIDKTNKRNMPNSYQGMYSSGTVSYMLDKPSMVFYTVDASYNGNDFWNEPKICRQMFHWAEEKLVQGRLYPQDNDGDDSVYAPYREIVQKIMSEIFDMPNLWTVSKGTCAASKYVNSDGTHYRDYENFCNCTLSRPKGSENEKYFTIGHMPICIKCGEEHSKDDNISCCASKVTCANCGCVIDGDDDEEIIWIEGEPYCRNCVSWCDDCENYFVGEATEVAGGYYVCHDCLDNYYRQCSDCGEYHRESRMTYVDSIEDYVCRDCLEENYSFCDDCGELLRSEDLTEHNGRWLCDSCLEEAKAQEEDDEEENDEAEAI